MLEPAPDSIDWRAIARPLATAERALGRLSFALDATTLYPTWLWREITRAAMIVAQAAGGHGRVGHLRLALIGLPVAREHNTTGLAAAKRLFLESAPLFRGGSRTDSVVGLWPDCWRIGPPNAEPSGDQKENEQGHRLITLVRELAGFADDGQRPALINLLVDLRHHAASRQLPAALVRIALPLALAEAGVVPKAAPGLLGGRRLALGMSRSSPDPQPLTDWLAEALKALTQEAGQAYRRLAELTRQHRAWHDALAGAGLRRHARAPLVLDLLAATAVLTIGLVARHLDCSHVAAGQIVARLAELGILIEQTVRSRHKVFVAGDLAQTDRARPEPHAPLTVSEPPPAIDREALEVTLGGLFTDIDRANARMDAILARGGR